MTAHAPDALAGGVLLDHDERVFDVLVCAQHWHQIEVLENEPDIAAPEVGRGAAVDPRHVGADRRPQPTDAGAGVEDDQVSVVAAHFDAGRVSAIENGRGPR